MAAGNVIKIYLGRNIMLLMIPKYAHRHTYTQYEKRKDNCCCDMYVTVYIYTPDKMDKEKRNR